MIVTTTTPSDPIDVPGVDTHPVVVWAGIVAVAVVVLAHAIAKTAGPLSEALARWREHRQAAEDARIVDLSHQVDHLAGRVWTLETRAERQDRYLVEHAAWDHDIMTAAIAAGLDVPPPPPLRAPIDPP